jgi:hypothetical protein
MPEISIEQENGLTADIPYLPDLFSEHNTDKKHEKKGRKVMSYDKLISLQPFFVESKEMGIDDENGTDQH